MHTRTWQLAKPKPAPPPRVPKEVREAVDAQAATVLEEIKKRLRKPSADRNLNWAENVLARWHREALYFVVIMRTPHGQPATFEIHAARMQHVGDGKFDYAGPMRRGWNTGKRNISVEDCMKEVQQSPYF